MCLLFHTIMLFFSLIKFTSLLKFWDELFNDRKMRKPCKLIVLICRREELANGNWYGTIRLIMNIHVCNEKINLFNNAGVVFSEKGWKLISGERREKSNC
jgi:hypothetical protein